MNPRDLSEAKDPDLRASLVAIQRAARLAREQAVQTNTAIVVQRNNQMIWCTAQELLDAKAADSSV
jgi:Tfp pilus assembly protein FimT